MSDTGPSTGSRTELEEAADQLRVGGARRPTRPPTLVERCAELAARARRRARLRRPRPRDELAGQERLL